MTSAFPQAHPVSARSLPSLILAAILALWLQLWWSLAPTWQHGEYYEYGWFVPPLVLFFAWRRWQELAAPEKAGQGRLPLWLGFAVAGTLLALPVLRAVEVADPGWRVPLLVQTGLTAGLAHFLLGKGFGWRVSWVFAPVTVFALSAVPWPWQIERLLIDRLTQFVIHLTSEIFLFFGQPVEVSGARLTMGQEVVEVTEGCSGIRSLQSLVMAALFFGELLRLAWTRRVALMALAAVCAVVVNTGRAWTLAHVQFTRGKDAAEAAHDGIGHAAFILSALLLLLSAWLLQLKRQRVVVRQAASARPAVQEE